MVGTLEQVRNDMKNGVYNLTQDGKCIGCGECCTRLLPVSEKELRLLHRYVDKKKIKPMGQPVPINKKIDLTCPFLNNFKTTEKCMVYPYRPEICRKFKCDLPSKKIEEDKNEFRKKYRLVDFYEEFFGKSLLSEMAELMSEDATE